MNCINDGILQKYIDGETTVKEAASIEHHIASCKKCAARLERQRELVASLKKSMNIPKEDKTGIPEFVFTEKTKGKSYFLQKNIYYYIAAACLLLFLLLIIPKKKTVQNPEDSVVISLSMGVDANRPVTQLPFTLQIIDKNGKVSEY